MKGIGASQGAHSRRGAKEGARGEWEMVAVGICAGGATKPVAQSERAAPFSMVQAFPVRSSSISLLVRRCSPDRMSKP